MYRFVLILMLLLSLRLVLFYAFPPKEQLIRQSAADNNVFTEIKGHVKETYSKYLDAQDSALLMGIVFGDKDLDRSSIQNFQKTGLLHIIAASGMNVSMMTSFLLSVLTLFIKRRAGLILTFLAVLLYCAFAGFQPSIVRAAIMACAAFSAGVLGRQNTSIIALLFAAYLMIFWDPSVVASISFILSFTATLGIIAIDPLFKRYISKSEALEDFRTTLSAQISTTPIILFFFGTYSPISILTNILVLWTVPPLMMLGSLAAILSFIPVLPAPFLLLSMPILAYFWEVTEIFAKYSIQFNSKNVPWTFIIGYYMTLAAALLSLHKKRKI